MRNGIRRLIILTITFTAASFAYSFFGFVPREPAIRFHEYSRMAFAEEVSGHVGFGMIAAVPLLDAEFILLTGILAIAIDIDHVLATLNLATTARTSHSFLFIPLACIVMACAAKEMGEPEARSAIIALLPITVFFAHISYDIFAAYVVFGGEGASFPLLAPFSFSLIYFSFWWWVGFEAVAIAAAAVLRLLY